MGTFVTRINFPSSLANELGIVRHIPFIDDADFKATHADLVIEKNTDSPDEDKSVDDASALVPVLQDFFSLHPAFHPDTFLTLAILLLIPQICAENFSTTFTFPKHLFLIIPGMKVL